MINRTAIRELIAAVEAYPNFDYSKIGPHQPAFGDCGCAIMVMRLGQIAGAKDRESISQLSQKLGLSYTQGEFLFNNETEKFEDGKAEFVRRAAVLLGEAEPTKHDLELLSDKVVEYDY